MDISVILPNIYIEYEKNKGYYTIYMKFSKMFLLTYKDSKFKLLVLYTFM